MKPGKRASGGRIKHPDSPGKSMGSNLKFWAHRAESNSALGTRAADEKPPQKRACGGGTHYHKGRGDVNVAMISPQARHPDADPRGAWRRSDGRGAYPESSTCDAA